MKRSEFAPPRGNETEPATAAEQAYLAKLLAKQGSEDRPLSKAAAAKIIQRRLEEIETSVQMLAAAE